MDGNIGMWEIGLVHSLNVKHPRFEEETVTGEFRSGSAGDSGPGQASIARQSTDD